MNIEQEHEKQRREEFESAQYLVDTLKEAEDYSLQIQFVVYFLKGLKLGYTTIEAVNYSRMEWDF